MNKYKFYINKRLITNNTKPFLIAESFSINFYIGRTKGFIFVAATAMA